jgi:hypothetical protein
MLLSGGLAGLKNEGSAATNIGQGPGILFDAGQMGVFCTLSRRPSSNDTGHRRTATLRRKNSLPRRYFCSGQA